MSSVTSGGTFTNKNLKTAKGFTMACIIIAVIAIVIIFVATFIYFINQTDQYKAACTGTKTKPSVTAIVMWVIGGVGLLAAIGLAIFAVVKGKSPYGMAASAASSALSA